MTRDTKRVYGLVTEYTLAGVGKNMDEFISKLDELIADMCNEHYNQGWNDGQQQLERRR